MARTMTNKWLWCTFLVSVLGLVGCQSNLVVRHRSFRANQPVQVFIDRKLVCEVRPQQDCKVNVKPGRHTFYAIAKGAPAHRWGEKASPTPFAVDKRTVIHLHDRNNAASVLPKAAKQRKKVALGRSFRKTIR